MTNCDVTNIRTDWKKSKTTDRKMDINTELDEKEKKVEKLLTQNTQRKGNRDEKIMLRKRKVKRGRECEVQRAKKQLKKVKIKKIERKTGNTKGQKNEEK